METLTTIGLALAGGAAGSELMRRGRALADRLRVAEQALAAHDAAILQLAVAANVSVCTCDDPACPANAPETPPAPQGGQYL